MANVHEGDGPGVIMSSSEAWVRVSKIKRSADQLRVE